MFFSALRYIFLLNSLFTNSKALLKDVLLITCFYCFSTCCFNFSKISSAVVDANSFTTFSRDLPPWTKSKKCCQDDSPNRERGARPCPQGCPVAAAFLTAELQHLLLSVLHSWSNQRVYLTVYLTTNVDNSSGFLPSHINLSNKNWHSNFKTNRVQK